MFDALGIRGSGGASRSSRADQVDVNEMLEKARDYVNEQISRAREYAQEHPRVVLGSLAGVVLGAGLLTAAAVARGKSGSKKSSSSGSRSRSSSSKSSKSRSSSGGSRSRKAK